MGSVVEITPLTRVEGHGSARVYLDGPRVERIELRLTDSPRLFESLLVGRSFVEIPEIICRICSLCSTVHKVTALAAVEHAFGTQISPVTALSRELIACGGLIQSHALHLYCLMLPDLMELTGVSGLALAAPELLKKGLAIKAVGNLIQETVGGRLIHPVNIVLGGLGRRVDRDRLRLLADRLSAILPACRETVRIFRTSFPFPELPPKPYLALEPFSHCKPATHFRLSDGRGFPVESYREQMVESVVPHSRAKTVRVLDEEPVVGALARLNLGSSPGRRGSDIFESVRQEIVGRDIRANNLAQAVELCQAAERSLALIDELLEIGQDGPGNMPVMPRDAQGSAAYEAPRGVLLHSYRFDDAGLCTLADVITPTALNQGALSRDLLALARGMEGADSTQLTCALERLIRCYDPCISCSVHVLRL